jgi:virulence factor Mce-like protein
LSKLTQRLVGIGLLGALVLAIVLGVTKPDPFAAAYKYWAVFNTAQGLGSIDRDVRVSGVKVGTVGTVERVGDDVRAELVLAQDIPVHVDARADMRPHTLFEGSNFVDLHPGSPSAPVLKQGGTIPRSQTTNYVTLDEALRVLRPEIRNNLQQLAKVGSRTFRGRAIDGLQRTLRNAPALTRDLADAARALQGPHRTELAGAISGIARTTRAVASQEEQLVPLAGRLNRTLAAVTTQGAVPLDAALVALPGALEEINGTSGSITALVDKLGRVSSDLVPALPDLKRAFNGATPVLKSATPVLRKATPLVKNARLIADRLGDAGEDGLVKMLKLLHEPLPKLQESLNVANSETRYGEPAYHQLVAGAFAGADGMFRSYQTPAQNPAGPGHVFRLGAYLDPEAVTGLTSLLGGGSGSLKAPARTSSMLEVNCSMVERVSRQAARELESAGGCR